jgi:hypothetical protein
MTAPTGTEATTARIAAVLAEHEPNGFSCACGWRNETATYATGPPRPRRRPPVSWRDPRHAGSGTARSGRRRGLARRDVQP